jgi:predicted transposase/invertase (TIGR01784 family)
VFKTLLTHPSAAPILKDVLSNCLELDIESASVENIEPPLPRIGKKSESFHAACEFNGGSHAVVEMQAKAMAGDTMESAIREIKYNAVHNISVLHSSRKGKDENRGKHIRTFKLLISGDTVFPDRKGFVNQFSWWDPDGYLLGDDEAIVFVELGKLNEAMKKPVEMMDGKEKWSIFFAYGADPSKKELMGKLADSKVEIRMAINLLSEISKDDNERLLYRARRKFEMDLASQIITASEQSWSEGKLEEREAIAKKMIILGLDNSIIEQSTGFSTDEIYAIRSKPSPQTPLENHNSSPDA